MRASNLDSGNRFFVGFSHSQTGMCGAQILQLFQGQFTLSSQATAALESGALMFFA
jgi:hypothetical protein